MGESKQRAASEETVTDTALEAATRGQAELMALDAVFMRLTLSPDGIVEQCNEAFAAAMGYDPSQIVGQAESLVVNDRGRDEYRVTWQRLRGGQPVSDTFERQARDGATRYLRGVYIPLVDDGGEVSEIVLYANDVTSEVKAARQREAERAAVNQGFAIINFTPSGEILGANAAFCQTVGYENAEIKGRHHAMFVHPEERDTPRYQRFWKDLAAGKAQPGDVRRVRKDGSDLWLKAVYAPVPDEEGNIVSVVKYATDISDQVRLRHSIEAMVAETREVMGAVAEGDLSRRMVGEYAGELEQVADDINTTCERLADMTRRIRAASDQITMNSATVMEGNRTLAQRTEEQASFLEETAANMEEMTGTVRQNADNARQADRLAAEARDSATKGGEVVDRAVAAMREINSSSRQISDIIGVIDEIAFQTNLLALNAAVEAARAGEQGRGFAVVASEVRNLAQRSASAAKDIKTLIQDSLKKVDEGSHLVDESGTTLEEIVGSVRKVSDLITDIATASAEQSSGIEQISKSISHMDQMTQQNASLTEEATAASDAARQQADELKQLVSFFRDGAGPEATVAPSAPGRGDVAEVDRRGPGRPWAERQEAGAVAAPAPVRRAAVGGMAAEDDWSEF
jgi:methyl-accepting chemotaxis protein